MPFPETAASQGIIESELAAIPQMQQQLEQYFGQSIHGQLWLKKDSHLPISGSIKARGGIYEVLCHAEKLAIQAQRLNLEDDYAKLDSPEFKQFFSQYSIAVGSTGNLGLSIGITRIDITRIHTDVKPLHTLLTGAMRKAVWYRITTCFFLQVVITNFFSSIHRLFNITLF